MRLDCVATSVTLFINGQRVASVDDQRLPSGLSGIRARRYNGAIKAELIFRNFLVFKR